MNWAYLYTFLQTCVIEFPFYYYYFRPRLRPAQSVCAVLALNACTHPLVFFFFMTLKLTVLQDILLAEAFAFAFEIWACVYFLRLKPREALWAGGLANLASWQLGSILTYLMVWR